MNMAVLIELLRDVAKSAYWYGESTGDYNMTDAHHTEWLLDAAQEIVALLADAEVKP